jgi:hypothetical protein
MYIQRETKINTFEPYLYDEHLAALLDSKDITDCYHAQCESNQNSYYAKNVDV